MKEETTTAPDAYTEIVARYIQIRDAISDKEAAHKAEIAEYKAALAKIERHLLTRLIHMGASHVNTPAGGFYRTERTSATVADWSAVLSHIQEQQLWGMLEKKVNKTAVKEYIAEHGDLPPGVDFRREAIVLVRRP